MKEEENGFAAALALMKKLVREDEKIDDACRNRVLSLLSHVCEAKDEKIAQRLEIELML